MECRRVQEDRPSCSTSGGHSFAMGRVEADLVESFLVWDVNEAKELHERQLELWLVLLSFL